MEMLEKEIIQFKSSLIVIDSLASIVRWEFSGNNASVFAERAIFLSKISSYLKKIAQLLDVSVI